MLTVAPMVRWISSLRKERFISAQTFLKNRALRVGWEIVGTWQTFCVNYSYGLWLSAGVHAEDSVGD
jgi:hypothetical protein